MLFCKRKLQFILDFICSHLWVAPATCFRDIVLFVILGISWLTKDGFSIIWMLYSWHIWIITDDDALVYFPTSSYSGLSILDLRQIETWLSTSNALFNSRSIQVNLTSWSIEWIHVHISIGTLWLIIVLRWRLITWRIGQRIQRLQSSFLIDEFRKRLKLKLEDWDLLPRLFDLIVIGLDLLLTPLIFLLKDNQILLEDLFRAGKLVIHEFKLI